VDSNSLRSTVETFFEGLCLRVRYEIYGPSSHSPQTSRLAVSDAYLAGLSSRSVLVFSFLERSLPAGVVVFSMAKPAPPGFNLGPRSLKVWRAGGPGHDLPFFWQFKQFGQPSSCTSLVNALEGSLLWSEPYRTLSIVRRCSEAVRTPCTY
jgi:hypothetical protein